MASKVPRRLKKLEVSDLLTLVTSSKDTLVVTKQETASVIRSFIKSECANVLDDVKNEVSAIADDIVENKHVALQTEVDNRLDKLEKKTKEKLEFVEKSIDAFIEHRFNQLAEKICTLLITRKFNDEVTAKTKELLYKKSIKGKF